MPDSNQPRMKANPAQVEEAGRLKIFLGFAAGVGKTFAMLDEAHRRKKRGQDVVIGYVDSHGRAATQEETRDLEVIPPRQINYRGASLEEMDTEAILRRKPEVVLIDELEHTNVPGAERDKRWQDVELILESGISVISTLNVQHIESLNDQISDITGIRVRETVPDHVLHQAEEVELVDLTPRALINRLERGDVYPGESIDPARAAFFGEGNLSALREIAMREIAGRVDEDVTEFRRDNNIRKPWATKDRVMICISPSRSSLRLVRRGFRIGQRMRADTVAVHVEEKAPGEKEQKIIRDDFALAERLGIPTVRLHGEVAAELIKYAQDNDVSQLVIGHSTRSRMQEVLKGSLINDLARALKTVDILVVALDTDEVAPSDH